MRTNLTIKDALPKGFQRSFYVEMPAIPFIGMKVHLRPDQREHNSCIFTVVDVLFVDVGTKVLELNVDIRYQPSTVREWGFGRNPAHGVEPF